MEAWWTAGRNRSPAARYEVSASDGTLLGQPQIDQQQGGGEWAELGSWSFHAGWNIVRLTAAGEPGCVVIADAVRVR